MIRPYGLQCQQKQRVSEEAADRNIEVLQKIISDRTLQILCYRRDSGIDASKHKWNHLAHVPDDNLQGWQAIKDSCQDQAQRMNGGFVVPAPTAGRQHIAHGWIKACIVCFSYGQRWRSWMNINRHIQRDSLLKNWQEGRIIQKAPVGCAIDHSSFEAKRVHGALKLGDGGLW